MVHDVRTLGMSYIRMILSVTTVSGFRMFSNDFTEAYLQRKPQLSRQVYIRSKAADRDVLGLVGGEIFQLFRPLYGLCGSGDYWVDIMETHQACDLPMRPRGGDPSLYYMKRRG